MPATDKLWLCPPADSCLLPREVQVWGAWLDAASEAPDEFWPTLSAQEQDRAARFAAQRERARFVVARGLLRALLGSALGVEPQKLEFLYGANGKPSLGGALARSGLQFNLAHSGGLAIFAVARERSVGVDVEQLRPVPDLSDLIQRYLSPRECAELKELTGAAERRGFVRWDPERGLVEGDGRGHHC